MKQNLDDIRQRIETASPLELPQAIMEVELYEQETARELLEKVNDEFRREEVIDNVVTPVFTTVIDGILAHPKFKGLASKSGLSAQRVMKECAEFRYDGKIVYLMPDAFVEYRNEKGEARLWGQENRSKYIRDTYHDTSAMGRYKNERVEENGVRKNLEDEYLKTRNITARKNNPDGRRNDPDHQYNSETDHVVPLKTVFDQLQNNCALSNDDIRRIANQDYNFALTARRVNNPKRQLSNSEFIARQDDLKAAGKPYVELSPEVRANMMRMEQEAQKAIDESVNATVFRNLTGRGQADADEHLTAMQRAISIHKTNALKAGRQSLMYAIGSAVLLLLKPLYYEIKDGFLYGFREGVGADTYSQAVSVRFGRIKNYVWSELQDLKSLLGSAMEMLKNFLSALVEGLIGMFVGLFRQILKVLKEGVKLFTQAWPVLFGEQKDKLTPAQKGDVLLKLVAGSAVALCGIGIDSLLERAHVQEEFRGIASVVLTGLASALVFYALDRADLFGVKKEIRERRIKEIFDSRIQDIKDATSSMEQSAMESLRRQTTEQVAVARQISVAMARQDYAGLNDALVRYARFLNIPLQYQTVEEIHRHRKNLNLDL